MSLLRYRESDLSPWTPFDRLTSLREDLNRLFDFPFPGVNRDGGLFNGWNPSLDLYEDKDNLFVKVELPGMKKEEIEISLQDGVLSLGGERKQEEQAREGNAYRNERSFGRFHRSLSLPAAVDSTKVAASYKDGILTVTLPKAEEAKPKQIAVTVS